MTDKSLEGPFLVEKLQWLAYETGGSDASALWKNDDNGHYVSVSEAMAEAAEALAAMRAERDEARPINMILHCPKCGLQHVDGPEFTTVHRSHLCRECGCIWRPADVPTNGVASIETVGKADNFDPQVPTRAETAERERDEALKPLKPLKPFVETLAGWNCSREMTCWLRLYFQSALSAKPLPS